MSDIMQITEFFKHCSWIFSKENDLSDITWAMCMSSENFRNDFLHFFFPNIEIKEDIRIEREKTKDDSRPDFHIENGEDIFLIENKINDKNHHFDQYVKTFNIKPENLGYITNYEIDKKYLDKKYSIKTWEELYNKFSSDIKDENQKDELLLKGYLEYVKAVCGIIKINKVMKLDGIYSLFSLMEILKTLSQRKTEDFELTPWYSNRWN